MSVEIQPSKKFEDNPNFFRSDKNAEENKIIKKRLRLMQYLGMVEVEPFNFGLVKTKNHNATSGLYIEMVWNYSDQQFKEYMFC